MTPPNTLHARTKAFAKDYPIKSWWCIVTTAFFLGSALLGTFPGFPWPVRLICSLLAGLLTVRLFVIYHDQQHHAILHKDRLADFFMRAFGILVLCPSSIWRSSHDYHHAHNSKPRSAHIGSYPVMTKDQYISSSRAERFRYLFARHPLTILFGYVFVFLIGMVILPFINSPRRHFDCLLALLLHVALATALVMSFGWTAAVLTLLLPLMIAASLGAYLFYAQHNFPSVVFKDKAGWTFEGAAMESSSYMKASGLTAWFTGNIGYHHIHHINHRIPFYRLPETYRAIPELQRAKTTSLWPLEIIRCLRLKVWCVETQRMIGVRGL